MITTHFLAPRRSAPPSALRGFSDFDRFFDGLRNGFGHPLAEVRALAPRVDVTETETEYRVSAELPGLEEKDIQVSLEDGVLTIRGERAEEKQEGEKNARHVETWRGKSQRSLRLPSEVDPDGVKAAYRAGILTVTLPKAPAAQVRNIPITS